MSKVINKNNLQNSIDRFYFEIALKNSLSLRDTYFMPIKVKRIVAHCNYNARAVRNQRDTAYEYEEESAIVVKSNVAGGDFKICPAGAYVDFTVENGITLVWETNNPVFIRSKYDYLMLYDSFIRFLEDDSERDDFKGIDYKICFSGLYDSMEIEEFSEADIVDTPCFSFENFNNNLKLYSHEGIF